MKSIDLDFLPEPAIRFGHDQDMADPRDGLVLFGPYESSGGREVRIGVIGTREGIDAYSMFVETVSAPLLSSNFARPSFPGVEAVYGVRWPSEPALRCELSQLTLAKKLETGNLQQRTYDLVSLYLDKMTRSRDNEETQIDIWYVVVPQRLWRDCRPLSRSAGKVITSSEIMDARDAQRLLFDDVEEDLGRKLEISYADPDFHDQLKARALAASIYVPIQVVVEPTLRFLSKEKLEPYKPEMRAHLAWTQTNSLYYKLGRLPWRLSQVREGVCYLGVVFKRLTNQDERRFACSAAQLFLDSGDGTIFRGNNGPWLDTETLEFHLDRKGARLLLAKAIEAYVNRNGKPPEEVFVHGRARFSSEEWAGFQEAANLSPQRVRIVGVSIRETGNMKLYRDVQGQPTRYGVMRGTILIIGEAEGYLWTRGFVPRLQTSTSLETPNPINIKVTHGSADIQTVLADILALTKVNYNSCVFGDGIPVTLRFSNHVGDILTAIPNLENAPQPFKYYI